MLERFTTGTPGFLRKANAVVDRLNDGVVGESGDITKEQQQNGQVLLGIPALKSITNIRLMQLEVCVAGVTQTVNVLVGDPVGS
jgi:hypothetical protein